MIDDVAWRADTGTEISVATASASELVIALFDKASADAALPIMTADRLTSTLDVWFERTSTLGTPLRLPPTRVTRGAPEAGTLVLLS